MTSQTKRPEIASTSSGPGPYHFETNLLPEQKLEFVRTLQAVGHTVGTISDESTFRAYVAESVRQLLEYP